MTTEHVDFLAKSIEHDEYKNSTWYNEPLSFARLERKCVTLHKRDKDNDVKETWFAIENMLSLMTGSKMSYDHNPRCLWEIDFVRFLLGFTTQQEEVQFNKLVQDQTKLCSVDNSITKLIGKGMTRVLRHGGTTRKIRDEMNSKGALPLDILLDNLWGKASSYQQCKVGHLFAAMLTGNDKQRFYVDIYLADKWFPQKDDFPWMVYIGCHQGHSTGVIAPEALNHLLTPIECFSLGWIFHTTDKRFEGSICQYGLLRNNRDALHFMYENDGSAGYISKGAGTREPRKYPNSIYVVLNIPMLLRNKYDLYLTGNGVVLVYADLPVEYFIIVNEFPHLTLNVFHPTLGHSLSREVRYGSWRKDIKEVDKYKEYLPSGEMSKYLDEHGDLVKNWMPRNIITRRRTSAWEFMGQTPPEPYLKCLKTLFEGSTAEASSGSTPVEEFNVEAELSTMNNLEMQAVKIISENPWHLYQAGVLTLRTIEGKKVTNDFGEAVVVLREFFRMSSTQQKTLLSEGITRHVWERCPLAGHSVLFLTRAWELGRLSAYVKRYKKDEINEFQYELDKREDITWMRDIPLPRSSQSLGNVSHEELERAVIEENEYMKDQGEMRMFRLFAESVEDLYNGMIENFVRDTPALWEEFAMRLPSGEFYLVDPDPFAGTPTVPTKENICLDIHNNVKFSPKLCLWAIQKKLEDTGEKFSDDQFAGFCFNELKEYVESRTHLDDEFYRHLVINTQSRTFEDPNYVNTIGSKVTLRSVGEMMELSIKRNKMLQRTMVIPKVEEASSSKDAAGDLPSGEIPDASMKVEESTEHLQPGEISVEEAAAKDVEMEAAKEEEVPHDEPPQAPQQEAPRQEEPQRDVQMQEEVAPPEGPDYGPYEEDPLTEEQIQRANEIMNSQYMDVLEQYDSEDSDASPKPVAPRPRIATEQQARFINNMCNAELGRIDAILALERGAREEVHRRTREAEQQGEEQQQDEPMAAGDLPPGEIPEEPKKEEVKKEKDEAVVYQDELEARKKIDIFAQPSSSEFLKLLAPEAEPINTEAQSSLEEGFFKRQKPIYSRPFQNKMPGRLDEALEKEPRVKMQVPKPEPKGEDNSQQKFTSPLDKLSVLDRHYKSKFFGFYGKNFRETHNQALNFGRFRKGPTAHPCGKFDFDEEKFVDIYCDLFFNQPTPEDFFYQKPIVYQCEDHRIKVANDDKMEDRSRTAKENFDEKVKYFKEQIKVAGKKEVAYDDMITDITQLFLSGEKIERNPESVGSSSKSLSVLFWNLGNWSRGTNFKVPSDVEYNNLFYKEEKPGEYPDHVPEANNLFVQMVKNLRAHVVLNCEASSLLPYRTYLEKYGWTLCFNDATDLCCLARVGVEGSIKQIAGPNEENSANIWSGPKRRVSFAIFEIHWGKCIPRGAFAASSTGYFSREDPQDYDPMMRARMTSTRVCIYHVDNVDAGKSHSITGECFAEMLYECIIHQVTCIGGDANRLAYQRAGQQLNFSYGMSTVQFWLDRMEMTMDKYFKQEFDGTCRDMNVRQFHTCSFLDLMYLRDQLEGAVDVSQKVRDETENIGDCCSLTFFEYGLSMQKDGFFDKTQEGYLEYNYSVNEHMFYLTNDILLLRERDSDAHCPVLVTIEPHDMTNQERKSFKTDESKMARAEKRKADQKAKKALGKARPSN